MVILGGMGNIWGVVLGAVVLACLNFKGLDEIGDRLNQRSVRSASTSIDVPKHEFLIFGILLVI